MSRDERAHQIDGVSEKGQECQAVRIFGKDNFSTVDLATSMPSLRSSPTIRGEPQPILASDNLRINDLISFDTVGLPGLPCLLNLAQ